jgi:hypothetical protein
MGRLRAPQAGLWQGLPYRAERECYAPSGCSIVMNLPLTVPCLVARHGPSRERGLPHLVGREHVIEGVIGRRCHEALRSFV